MGPVEEDTDVQITIAFEQLDYDTKKILLSLAREIDKLREELQDVMEANKLWSGR